MLLIGFTQGSSNQIPGPNGELAHWNGDASRLHVRKAQYHYGWDWGPILMCIGPWKPIRLEAYTLRIAEMRTEVDLESTANIIIHADLSGTNNVTHIATVTIIDPDGTKHNITSELAAGAKLAEATIRIDNPQLWYTVGHGKQPLYTAILEISDGKSILAKGEKRIGLRKVRVVQKGLEGEDEGGSFYFEINGMSIFAGGMLLTVPS
jgi:beta-mannosidase